MYYKVAKGVAPTVQGMAKPHEGVLEVAPYRNLHGTKLCRLYEKPNEDSPWKIHVRICTIISLGPSKDGAFKIWNYSLFMPKSDGLIVTAPASYMSQQAFDAKFSMNSWECCLS